MDYNKFSQQNSHLSLLQRRLNYAKKYIKKPLIFVENVPQWPNGFPNVLFSHSCGAIYYADSQGQEDLIEEICSREKSVYGNLYINSRNVLITNGGFHAFSLLSRFLYKPGAVACCYIPALKNIEDILRLCGYKVCNFLLRNGHIDTSLIGKAARQNPTLIYVNSPNNPTGIIYAKKEIKKLIQYASLNKNISVVFDSVYDSFVFDNKETFSPLMMEDCWQRTFVINSMSKNFGAPGLRVGWIISDFSNIEKLTGDLETECISINNVAQHQARELLKKGNRLLVEKVNLDRIFLKEKLKEISNVRFCVPEGGTMFLVQLPVGDIEDFADFMLTNYGLVLVTSGAYVGVKEACIRIPLGQPRVDMVKAVELLKQGLRNYKP
jgi:aspartate aminotransferase